MLASKALCSSKEDIAKKALHKELGRGVANPFLAEFYFEALKSQKSPEVPAEHVGVLYGSLRARLSSSQTARLCISEGEEDKVDIIITKRNKEGRDQVDQVDHRFVADAGGSFVFGHKIEDVNISALDADASFGYGVRGGEAEFVAPVFINVREISFSDINQCGG